MSRALFGTDGVRGLAGQYPLDNFGAERIGRAVGTHFAMPGEQVIIGSDSRESSARLVADLTAGLNSVGVDVVSVGVIPTPGLAYLTSQTNSFAAGVMVTASHNPYQYNGVKVFDAQGDKLSDDTEATLNQMIEDGVAERGFGNSSLDDKLISQYEDFLVNSAPGLQLNGLKVAIDSANGAACGLGERVFKRLGAQVKPLFDSPDGRNINDGCGATHTGPLSREVSAGKLDLGVALDGDADRIMLIDEKGRELNGDHILYILAVSGNLKGVVATVMTNLGLEKALQARDISLDRVQVGDRYVLEGLAETGFSLGGEQSGHIILPELLATGDALLAAVQVIKAVQASGKSLAAWRDEVKLLPQALVNIPVSDKSLLHQPEVQEFIAAKTEQLAGNGRVLIRPSGTEPLARVMVEAPDAQPLAESMAAELKDILAE